MNPLTSDPTREPLFAKATVLAAVTGVCTVLASVGVHVAPGVQNAVIQLAPAAAILMPFVTAWLARKHVTPVADPKGADGTALVPATPTAEPADPAP